MCINDNNTCDGSCDRDPRHACNQWGKFISSKHSWEKEHRDSLARFTRDTFRRGIIVGFVIGTTIVGLIWMWS